MRSASSENAPTAAGWDGADRARKKSYVQFMFLLQRSARTVNCFYILFVPNTRSYRVALRHSMLAKNVSSTAHLRCILCPWVDMALDAPKVSC